MDLSNVARTAEPSATLSLNALAKQLAAQGEEIVSFTVGEPDFDTPENIKQAAVRAIQAGYTKYSPASGYPDLRSAISKSLKEHNGLDYPPERIMVSNGAKQALYLLMLCVLDPGDQVLLPAPYWPSYADQAKACGAEPVVIDCSGEPGFKLSPEALEAAVGPKTKLLIINTPCNPTGMAYDEEELRALAETALKHDLWIFADEVYERLVYEDLKHVSLATLSEEFYRRTVTFNAVSKTYAMTGWRIGYAAGPQEIMTAAGRLQSNLTSGPNSIAQKAALEALTGPQDSAEEMRQTFEKRRNLLVGGLNDIEGIACEKPGGAFYAFPDCSGLLGHKYNGMMIEDSMSLSKALLETVGLAVVPGAPFGAEGFLRFSYAVSEEDIEKGLQLLRKFIGMREDA